MAHAFGLGVSIPVENGALKTKLDVLPYTHSASHGSRCLRQALSIECFG